MSLRGTGTGLMIMGLSTVRDHRGARACRVNEHRPHRSLDQAAPLKPLPNAVADLDAFSARRRDLIGGVIHEYAQVA